MGNRSWIVAIALCFFFSAVQCAIDPKEAEKLAEKVENEPLFKKNPSNVEKWETVAGQVKQAGGCGRNVCFAIDGSSSIPVEDYKLQLSFVSLIAAIIGADENTRLAAAQYGRELEVIRKLTPNAGAFLLSVDQSRFLNSPATFIEPGLIFCDFQLSPVAGQPAKIVLLGDGRSNVFDREFARLTAQDFRKAAPGNEICAVGVGFKDESLLAEIVGSPSRVFDVTQWPVILNILDTLVEELCEIKLPPPPPPSPPSGPKCPCSCFPAGSGKKGPRKAQRKASKQCNKNPGCSVVQCNSPFGYKCC